MNLTEFNQTDRCLQFSCPERSVSAVYVLLYTCVFAVVLLTVCGNLLVIISVCHFKQLHTPTNMLVLSLAMSDFMVGLFVMPFHLIRLTESCWIFGSTICVFSVFISFIVTSISIYSVALIAIDRYFAISNPFLYIEKVSVNTVAIVVISNWAILFLYSLALLYFNGNSTGLVICPGECLFVLHEIWSLVDLVFAFIIPCCIIIIFYVLVFFIARKHATAIRELNVHTKLQTSKNVSDIMKSERKAAKVLFILVSVFLACLFPYFLTSLVSNAIETESLYNLVVLLQLNSSVNPIIYALFYPWFRKCLKVTLTLQICTANSALLNVH